MDYLFAQSGRIEVLLRHKFILLLLDYDGSLTPIVKKPQDAVISKGIKGLLQRIADNPDCALGIISGRSLQDIKKTVGIKDIIYAGNHGLEIEGPKIKFEVRVPSGSKSVMRNIAQGLRKSLARIKGAFIEDKGLTLSIHYRLVSKDGMPAFKRFFSEVTNPYAVRSKIKINPGKKVYEIKPPVKWDKGKVVLWLMKRQRSASGGKKVLPVYIGDDLTDEDAFKALKNKGLTVFVGRPRSSSAGYYLKNTGEVIKFLRLISEVRHN